MNEFSFKELYDVKLKTNEQLIINEQIIEEGETIAFFDKIQLSNFNEIKKFISANGGLGNEGKVFWDDTKEIQIQLKQGIFSKQQYALMYNSNLISLKQEGIVISQRELNQSDEEGKIYLKECPVGKIFIYDNFGNKINIIEQNQKVLTIDKDYEKVLVDYDFLYDNKITKIEIGKSLIKGFLSLEGKTKTKDDETGRIRTAIIKIPKIKIMSELSMQLGKNAYPVVGNMSIIGYPSGVKGSKKVMEIFFLENDIDSDIK